MSKSYLNYPVSVQLLQKHMFCTLDEFRSFINKYVHSYCLHINRSYRSTVKADFLSLRIEAPFRRTMRFPDTFYIDMDSAKIRTVTIQFLNALLLLDLWEEKYLVEHNSIYDNRIKYINNVTDANSAFAKFSDIIMSTENLEENGIYCRQTFETKYALRWYPQDD